ncbi:MAG: hypothetical protein GX605_11745, partial [Chloroflexi bacterium]|nr:hypothetical protein [Chloroflexota bacterium]
MCTYNLNRLVGTAVVDREFGRRLLTDAYAAVSEFDLTAEERQLVTSVRASSIVEF